MQKYADGVNAYIHAHRDNLPVEFQLLGYVPSSIQIEGTLIPRVFLDVTSQSEGGEEVYAEGARLWDAFFKREVAQFMVKGLDPLGKKIIQACLDGASQEDYWKLIPHRMYSD